MYKIHLNDFLKYQKDRYVIKATILGLVWNYKS